MMGRSTAGSSEGTRRRKPDPPPAEKKPPPVITWERVEKARNGLLEATQKMNEVLLRAEAVFDRLGLHKEASIPLPSDDEIRYRNQPPRPKKEQSLVWQLLDGRWQMVVEVRQPAKGGGTFTTSNPLLSASRQTRTAALRLIKEFHAALVTASGRSKQPLV